MPPADTRVVHVGRLVDVVSGEVHADRALVLDGDRIADVVPAADAPPGDTIDLSDRTVLPGLIDCHAHFAHWGMNLIAHQDKSLMLLAAETVAALRTTLEVGCTTARDLGGLDAVLMVSGREAPDRLAQHRAFVDAAVEAGVGHVVYTSFYRAAPDAVFSHGVLHWDTEQYIRASGVPFTFLRGNLYLEVLQYAVGPDQTIHARPAAPGDSPPSRATTWHRWPRQCSCRPTRTPARPMTSPGRRRFPSGNWRRRSRRRAGRRSTMQTRTSATQL